MSPENPAASSPAPRPAKMIIHQPTWRQRLLARLAYLLIRTLAATLRYRWARDPRTLPLEGRPYIFCTWHNRLSLALIAYEKWMRQCGGTPHMAAIVSASRDGAVLTRILELFHVQPARGSSSRRGAQVVLELASWAERGYDVAFAPDGPRGPRYQLKAGVITLSQITGRPLVPASFHLSSKITAKSWDAFQIPLPFCQCTINVGEPLHVPRELTDEQREALRQELENRINALTQD